MTALLVAVLVAVVLPAVGVLLRNTIVKLKPAQLRELYDLAATAVAAAEKVGVVAGLNSADKYQYAENSLIEFGKKVGLKVTPTLANTFIHSVLQEADNVQDILSQSIGTVTEEAA